MEPQTDPVTLEQNDAKLLRSLRWIAFWVLVGFVIGVAVGYGVFMMRDYDAQERYHQHILQFHSGRHQGV